jgi:Family of unknown function (DUF5719)
MKSLRSRRLLFAAFAVLALAALYGAAGLRHPVPAAGYAAAQTGREAVSTAVRACAAPGTAGVTAGSLAIAAVPGSASAGTAVATRLVPGGSAVAGPLAATVTRPDLLQVAAVKPAPALLKSLQAGQPGSTPKVTTQAARGGVVVTASGAMAQGLEVEQAGAGGLVTAQCGSPGTSFWFVGPGQSLAAQMQLYLMNTDSQAADVQVTALTDITKGGPLLGNADNGITVPPHSMVVQSVASLLQSSKVIALNVSTSVGQVVAALRESRSTADEGSWLPAAQAPARSLVIPGMPRAGGTRELYISVPGTAQAQLKVTAVTTRGSYQPTGGTDIDLLGGSAFILPLTSLSGVPGAIKISSTVPVEAAMLVSGGPAGAAGAVAVSAGPIQEQGVIAASPVGSAGSTALVLSAPQKAASVRITVATSSLSVTGQLGTVVQIKAGSSVVVPVKAPSGHRTSAVMIVVSPLAGSGPVYAGRVISTGGVVRSILPVPSSLTWIGVPVVHNSLSAIQP